ncbi:hypothetical protein [Streptomyces sp. NPDC001307]|uniref:hypothetical protein n=1 Tax=Streptomyces sp. NPDC001307 TaxID=3364560 RepID=UPI0036842FBF
MPPRAFAVVGAGIGATVLAATGITYASTAESSPASPPAHRAAQPLQHPAQPAHHAAQPAHPAASAAPAASATAPSSVKNGGGDGNEGRDGGGRDGGGRDDGGWGGGRDGGGRDGGSWGGGRDGGGRDGGSWGGGRDGGSWRGGGGGRDGRGWRGGGHGWGGRIFVNERSYPAFIEGCITAASGLGARSLNVLNESRRTVQVFRGFNCDGGPPIATVGPRSETFGVVPHGHDGGFGRHGVVGSFRVVCDYDGWW